MLGNAGRCWRAVSYTHLDVYKRQIYLRGNHDDVLDRFIPIQFEHFIICLLYTSRCV